MGGRGEELAAGSTRAQQLAASRPSPAPTRRSLVSPSRPQLGRNFSSFFGPANNNGSALVEAVEFGNEVTGTK